MLLVSLCKRRLSLASIAGSVGSFRTDARIFVNPSFTSDITVNASFLPAGNVSNAAVVPKAITIPKRKMVVYDDVVASLFATTGLGAIRLVSDGDFVATQRVYAVTADGTLGQFVPGLDVTAAKKKSVLIEPQVERRGRGEGDVSNQRRIRQSERDRGKPAADSLRQEQRGRRHRGLA